MIRALLFFALALSASAAVSECDADDATCNAEKDPSSLLQAEVRLANFASGSETAHEVAELTSKRTCSGAKDDCAEPDCTWTGSECRKGCSEFGNDEDSCPVVEEEGGVDGGYCYWLPASSNSGVGAHCSPFVRSLEVGGTRSGQSQFVLRRPNARQTTHYSAEDGWTACAGGATQENCWVSVESRRKYAGYQSDGQQHGGLHVTLTGTDYTKAAVDIAVDCTFDGEVRIIYFPDVWQNGKLAIRYDHKLAGEGQRFGKYKEQNRKDKRRHYRGQKRKKVLVIIPKTTGDKYQVLRLEASKAKSSVDGAKLHAVVQILRATYAFDHCMQTKATHGQCLDKMSSETQPIFRSSHAAAANCVNGVDNSAACVTWRTCLTPAAKELIVNVNGAFNLVPSLLQEKAAYQASQNMTGGSCSNAADCINPVLSDMESFDCKCFDAVNRKDAGEVNAWVCDTFALTADICCSWKNAPGNHCAGTATVPALLQERLSQKKEDSVSLDDSLAGKRACEKK